MKLSPTFINVFRGQGRYNLYEPDASSVSVLGSPALIGAIHEGVGVEFEVQSEPPGCREFVIEAFGVSEQEVRSFVEGLRK